MARYRVEVVRSATKSLAALPRHEQRRIAAAIDALRDEPRPDGCRKLQGSEGLYRLRAGDYRVVYEIRDSVLLVLVITIAHRKDAHR